MKAVVGLGLVQDAAAQLVGGRKILIDRDAELLPGLAGVLVQLGGEARVIRIKARVGDGKDKRRPAA